MAIFAYFCMEMCVKGLDKALLSDSERYTQGVKTA